MSRAFRQAISGPPPSRVLSAKPACTRTGKAMGAAAAFGEICYASVVLSPDELARARKLVSASAGDPLGLGVDDEATMVLVEAAAQRFFCEGPSLEALEAWEAIVSQASRRDDLPPSVREELQSHEHLIVALHECLNTSLPIARIHEVVQRSLAGLSVEVALRVAAGMTSLAVAIAETIGLEHKVGAPGNVRVEAPGG
jgi:hypothetical protein